MVVVSRNLMNGGSLKHLYFFRVMLWNNGVYIRGMVMLYGNGINIRGIVMFGVMVFISGV